MTPDEDLGRLLDRRTLTWERDLTVDADTLWQAIATRDGLAHWFMPTDTEIEEGGRFSFTGGWDGTVTRVEPGRLVEFTPDAAEGASLRFELEETDAGFRFRLTDTMAPDADASALFGDDTAAVQKHQPGGPGTHWSGVAAGYHGFVDALVAHLAGTEATFDYDAMARTYVDLLDRWHTT